MLLGSVVEQFVQSHFVCRRLIVVLEVKEGPVVLPRYQRMLVVRNLLVVQKEMVPLLEKTSLCRHYGLHALQECNSSHNDNGWVSDQHTIHPLSEKPMSLFERLLVVPVPSFLEVQ